MYIKYIKYYKPRYNFTKRHELLRQSIIMVTIDRIGTIVPFLSYLSTDRRLRYFPNEP